jgi:hypothetical protein
VVGIPARGIVTEEVAMQAPNILYILIALFPLGLGLG